MSTTGNLTIRIDKDLKEKAEMLFDDLGLTLSAAIIMFLKQAVREQGIPFEITLNVPNKATIEAMKEAEEMEKDPNAKTFSSVDELMKDLMS